MEYNCCLVGVIHISGCGFVFLLVFMFYSKMKKRQSHMSRGQTEPVVTGKAPGLSRHFHLVTFLSCDFVCLLKHGPFLLLNGKAELMQGVVEN